MTADVHDRLAIHVGAKAAWIEADPSLLVVPKPKCPNRWCVHGRVTPTRTQGWTTCPDCGGTGYVPMVALPAKVVEEVLATATCRADQDGDDHALAIEHLAEAVRLAQEEE